MFAYFSFGYYIKTEYLLIIFGGIFMSNKNNDNETENMMDLIRLINAKNHGRRIKKIMKENKAEDKKTN
jgi:hypothetical protein